MLETISYWTVLLAGGLLGALAHQYHVRQWNIQANLCITLCFFCIGIFLKETVAREFQKAIEEMEK